MGADVLVWELAGRGSDFSATWSLLVHLAVRWAAEVLRRELIYRLGDGQASRLSYLSDTSRPSSLLPPLQTTGSCRWRSSSSSLQMASSTRRSWRASSTPSTPTTPSEPGLPRLGWGGLPWVWGDPSSFLARQSVSVFHSPGGAGDPKHPRTCRPTGQVWWPPLAGVTDRGVGPGTSHWPVCLSWAHVAKKEQTLDAYSVPTW